MLSILTYMTDVVEISKKAKKDLRHAPKRIIIALYKWIELVETDGLEAARAIPGYNDEKLKAEREGQYSIRLSKQWRALHTISITVKKTKDKEKTRIITVIEVNAHEY